MPTISLCMIVKNESGHLPRCLKCAAHLVDEIIIVDTGSSDDTKDIALSFGAKVFDFEWCDDFAKARNYAFSNASCDYIFWLDADDYITPADQEKFLALKADALEGHDAVSMVYSLGRNQSGVTTVSLRRNRIVRRELNCRWIGRIHEYLETRGNHFLSDIEICHDKHSKYTDRNLKIFQSMLAAGETFTPRDVFYYAGELFYNGLYEEAIAQYRQFLDLGSGWVEDRKTAVINSVTSMGHLKKHQEQKPLLLEGLGWDKPRAQMLCMLAECFKRENNIHAAIYWYKSALVCTPEDGNMGLTIADYHGFVPAIELCVLYSQLGRFDVANHYNELAETFSPGSPSTAHNRTYLADKL